MTMVDKLASQHIREYKSRLKHIDELLERAHLANGELEVKHPLMTEVEQLREQHAELARSARQRREDSDDHWYEDIGGAVGPMAIWDILAEKLEDVVERIERSLTKKDDRE